MTTQLTANQHKYYGAIVAKLNRLKTECKSNFSLARQFKSSLDTILERRNAMFEMKQYKTLPAIYQSEIKGYFEGLLDAHWLQLEWVLYYDGKYIGNSKREKEATDNMYKNPNFDNSLVTGFHVYIGTEIKYN